VSYTWNDQIKPFCNHSSSVILDFDVEESDLASLSDLKRRIDAAQLMVECAVQESIERTRPAASEPEPEPVTRRWDPATLPPAPAAPSAPPPPPATAPPPPSGNGSGTFYGPPKSGRTFYCWLSKQPADVANRAAELAREWKRPWKFLEWSDGDIVHLYNTLTAVPSSNGNGTH
jgi:hypothetical protein